MPLLTWIDNRESIKSDMDTIEEWLNEQLIEDYQDKRETVASQGEASCNVVPILRDFVKSGGLSPISEPANATLERLLKSLIPCSSQITGAPKNQNV
jgi:hypothetical protein